MNRLVNGSVPKQEAPNQPTCQLTSTLSGGTPLSDSYAELRTQGEEKLEELFNEAMASIKTEEAKLPDMVNKAKNTLLEKAAEKYVGPKLKAFQPKMDELVKLLTLGEQIDVSTAAPGDQDDIKTQFNNLKDSMREILRFADDRATFVLGTVDDTRNLAREIYKEAKGVVKDREKQAAAFNAFVTTLNKEDSIFEPYRDNPALQADEVELGMEYGDKFQWYAGAPWFAVPLQPSEDWTAEASGATALPLLDALGFRLQWGKTRFGDFRVGAGAGYTAIDVEEDAPKESAVLPYLSVGFATFKVGYGAAFGPKDFNWKDRQRFLVGVDLYKLITGENPEVL